MVVEQTRLAEILLYSFLLGIFLGVVYDLFRIRRQLFSIGSAKKAANVQETTNRICLIEDVIIFFEDVFYSIICSVVVCIFLFYVNHGRFRVIALVGAGLGFLVYYKTVGRLVLFCSEKIVRFIRFLIGKIIKLTVVPIFRLLKFLFKITLGRLYVYCYSAVLKRVCLRRANKGFRILQTKGKKKDEKSFKYIREGGGRGIHSVLHGYHNSDAV